MERPTIDAINAERRHQVVDKGFTKETDNDMQPHQWEDLLKERVAMIGHSESEEEYRYRILQVAAIAVSAIEAYHRTFG